MYVKIFQQIFDSSIAANYKTRHLFEDLLKLANPKGIVDMTPLSISRRTGIPLDEVVAGIADLVKPDPESRTPDCEGARLVLLDAHRSWGWRIVNYHKYRSITNEESRHQQMREASQRYRLKKDEDEKTRHQKRHHTVINASSPVIQAEAEAEAEAEQITSSPSAQKRVVVSKKATTDNAETIYNAYPRKTAKQEALKAIRKALSKVKAETLLIATQGYAAAVAKWPEEDRKYVPYPATWFNRGNYEDDPQEWERKAAGQSSEKDVNLEMLDNIMAAPKLTQEEWDALGPGIRKETAFIEHCKKAPPETFDFNEQEPEKKKA